ncbi:hypothetical protein Tco_1107325 [Tanacetum coccineum]
MALPEDHLAKFHKMTDAKDMWDAIKSRFGGNDESKKMQKYILKQQFEGFSVSNSEGLHKGYDRFQSLLSQLEIHGAGVSTEDANQKFLRSLPSSWSQVSLVMRTKPGVDSLSIDDLYNNLRVFESDIKGSTGSSFSAQNVAFFSSESTSSTNDVSTVYGVSASSGYNSHSGCVVRMDLKWQVAMISIRLKKFYKKTGMKLHFDAKEPVGFDKTKEEPKALVTLDGEGVDWTDHAEDEQENFALMAYSNSGSDTERSIRYSSKNQLWYEERFYWKIDLDDKTDVLTYHKKLLAETVKEKEELKTKLDNFQSSSKGLSKLLNSQISKRDKYGLGYGDQSPPMIGTYMPSGPDREVDDSMFTYGPKQSKTSESAATIEPKVVSQPKVLSDAPIIEEYESDSDDEYTKIHVDNESAICVVKNPVYHSKTKHIEIRHHFIRDSYEKKLIEMVKIHTDYNVADLLTKAFDVTRFQFLIASIGLELQGYLNNDGYADLVRMLVTLLILLMFHMIGLHHITNGHQFTMSNRQERIGYSRANDNCVERAITTDASLDAAQDNDNIFKTQSMAMLNVDIPQGIYIGGSPRRQETIMGTPFLTMSERVLEQPNETPLLEGHTSRSGEGRMDQTFEFTNNVPSTPHDSPLTGGYTPEGRMKLDELITLCTKLSKYVLDLEKEKEAQAKEKSQEIGKKKEVKHLTPKKEKIQTNKDFEELDDHMENVEEETVDAATTGVSTAAVTISTAEPRTPPSSTTVFDDEDVTMAMAQTLIKMKEHKAKEKGVAITDVEDSSRNVRPRKDQGDLQIQADAELAQRLHEEELAELERRQKERVAQEEASMAALYEEYDTIQASIDADAFFAAKLQQEEREQFTIEEKA